MTLKSTLFAGILAASLAVPAFANDETVAAPLPQFTAADTQMLFEQDAKLVQLAALSPQEMKETEGASLKFPIRLYRGYAYRTWRGQIVRSDAHSDSSTNYVRASINSLSRQ